MNDRTSTTPLIGTIPPPRELQDHKTNQANGQLRIVVDDVVGAGGAQHRYAISGFDASGNPSYVDSMHPNVALLVFQNGPIPQAGVNGITQEALLAIVIDRLRSFQAGPYACRENALALTKLEEALHWLHHRTRLRELRGVEGTHSI